MGQHSKTWGDREKAPESVLHLPTTMSNAVLLSPREWIVVFAIVAAVLVIVPRVWKRVEPFTPAEDFRMPYELSNDYWTYQRWMEKAAADERIALIGDSVVWGEFVDPQHALSHFLNREIGRDVFVNAGLNGTHPLALQGLVDRYAGDLVNTRVILHCNLLWMTSEERDLRTDKEQEFNHPRIVPQFWPRIPSYKAPLEERLGVAVDHALPYRQWVHHIRATSFEGQDVHRWTLEHPYESPLAAIKLQSPTPENAPHSEPISWKPKGITVQDIPWIDLDSSLQWQAFRATVETLRSRGNSIFVVIGPFNEHLLTDASRDRHRRLVEQVSTWLKSAGIAHHVPELLPSDEYADASHPLAAGYERLAKEILANADFQRWLGDGR